MLNAYERQLADKIQTDTVFSELFAELVPDFGKCESLAGEMLRAAGRIGNRFFNDGEWMNVGIGIETVNPAARFLMSLGDERICEVIAQMCDAAENEFAGVYLECLQALEKYICKRIAEDESLKSTETEDMLECTFETTILLDSIDEYYDYDEDDIVFSKHGSMTVFIHF